MAINIQGSIDEILAAAEVAEVAFANFADVTSADANNANFADANANANSSNQYSNIIAKSYIQEDLISKKKILVTVSGPVDKNGQHHGICKIYSENVYVFMYFDNGSACFYKYVLVKRLGELYKGAINNCFCYHGLGHLTFVKCPNSTPNSIFSINGYFENGSIDCSKEVEIHYINGDIYIGYIDILLRRHGRGTMLYCHRTDNIASVEGFFKENYIDIGLKYKITCR
jgi:hypothetical protein